MSKETKVTVNQRGWVLAWGLLLSGAAAQAEVYTCTDKNGRRITSDRPIPECIDREQRVLGASGSERRRIGPTLTDQELREQEVQKRQRALEASREAELRRRDRVLQARYPDERAHLKEREHLLDLVDDVIGVSQSRIDTLLDDRKKIDTELEFYQGQVSKAPMRLQRQVTQNSEEIAEQKRFIAKQEQEKKRIHERMDEEMVTLRRLWAEQKAAQERWAQPPQK